MRRNKNALSVQQYEGHLKRLMALKKKSPRQNKPSVSNLRDVYHNQAAFIIRKPRIKTQNQASANHIKPLYKKQPRAITLPLVPQSQRQLLGKSLQDNKIQGRKAQLLLQNYLLGRRILQVKPSIKGVQFQKSFKNHEKYMGIRSKSRLLSANISQSRLQKFKSFKSREKEQHIPGGGKFIFSLHIKEIQAIIRLNDKAILYNIVIRLNHHVFRFTNLTGQDLKLVHSFRFRKRQIGKAFSLSVELQMIRSNDNKKYARFIINADKFLSEVKQTQKYQQYQNRCNNQLSSLIGSNSDKIVGTVLYDYWIRTEIK